MGMISKNNFLGQSGFIWWVGVVENRKDPLNVGRCQIRIFGWHTDNLQLIPSADLPWAHPVWPINDSQTSKTPHEGEMVVGFFYDGESGQFPAYFGVIPGIPIAAANQSKGFSDQRKDLSKSPVPFGESASLYPHNLGEPTTSRLYRHENISKTIIQRERDAVVSNIPVSDGTRWSQPSPSYNTIAPYNRVLDTESGHTMEFDDTKDAERVHIAHRTGTYTEMRPDGSKVTKVVGNNYEVTAGSDYVYIEGTCNVTVNGNVNLKASKVNAVADTFNLTGNLNVNGTITATGDVIGAGISLDKHTHPDPQGGNTGTPG